MQNDESRMQSGHSDRNRIRHSRFIILHSGVIPGFEILKPQSSFAIRHSHD